MQQDQNIAFMPLITWSIVLVACIFVLIALVQLFGRRKTHTSLQDFDPEDDTATIPASEPLPYRLTPLLTAAERRFFEALHTAVAGRAMICPKVGLGDLFRVDHPDYKKRSVYWNKINRKHADFVLCDPRTLLPLVGIELDDSSHDRPRRHQRDAFVDQVYTAAGLPLLHITGQRSYDVSVLQLQLQPFLGDSALPAPSPSTTSHVPAVTSTLSLPDSANVVCDPPSLPRRAEELAGYTPPHFASEPVVYHSQQSVPVSEANTPSAASVQAPPSCPQCGSLMVLRIATKGKHAGEQFWGCPRFPTCRAFLRYEQP